MFPKSITHNLSTKQSMLKGGCHPTLGCNKPFHMIRWKVSRTCWAWRADSHFTLLRLYSCVTFVLLLTSYKKVLFWIGFLSFDGSATWPAPWPSTSRWPWPTSGPSLTPGPAAGTRSSVFWWSASNNCLVHFTIIKTKELVVLHFILNDNFYETGPQDTCTS